jgi:cell wall-associated NlpC family hydrolase
MTQTEFINRAVGLPWVRWRSDWAACDCFGLIVLYFREVLGIDLGQVPQTDIASGFASMPGWSECGPDAGATCFMAWSDGAPTHCGILLSPSQVLHSEGDRKNGGSVRVSRISAMTRIYGDLHFYKYTC